MSKRAYSKLEFASQGHLLKETYALAFVNGVEAASAGCVYMLVVMSRVFVSSDVLTLTAGVTAPPPGTSQRHITVSVISNEQ